MAESTTTHPFKERDKNVVISNGVRYTKADADRLEVTAERTPYTKAEPVENKQRSTSAS